MKMRERRNELEVLLLPEDSAENEPRCRVVLRNISDCPLWVNQRLAVNHPASPPHFREVDFLIRDAYGQVAEFVTKIRVGFPRREDFIELPPGERVERSLNLADYYALEESEEYEVEAIYENYFVPEELRGSPVWTGRLVSRPLRLTLPSETPMLV
jgi:hypothetical protein